ncbi:aminotransferase class V-fold PLP-dependent enzyme [Candidatus Daviesbacteria bacterium]|nr:aminotransferase class V-fold PLP-dependent enzyme [Candidatus Daviesbacteria bacterium]
MSIFFTPGPSQLYPTIKDNIALAIKEEIMSISHRGRKFVQIFQSLTGNLKKLLSIPEDYHILFLSSATEAMERIIQNCVDKTSFHFINGAFSERFFKTAQQLKKKTFVEQVAWGESFTFEDISIPSEVELVCLTENETSTGVSIKMGEIYQYKRLYPDKLIAVDIVSSAPITKINFNLVDLVFFSVQKGFGLPAGLAVLIISPQALTKAKQLSQKNRNIGSYHNFLSLIESANKNQTVETPNVFCLFLLDRVVKDMLKKEIDSIRSEAEKKSELLYNYFDHSIFKPFVKNKKDRSKTVIVINTNGVSSDRVLEKLQEKNLILSTGYGKNKEAYVRIANFPTHSTREVNLLIETFKKVRF